MNADLLRKYRPRPVVDLPDRQWPNRQLTRTPMWCSVDLRDGNQALPVPMNVEEKLELFDLLVKIGFKEIEIGFPSASDTEFRFCRRLIEEGRIPGDVHVQVLTQAREHLIRRSFEAIDGAHTAIVHLYNSTSALQRAVTFGGATPEDIRRIATDHTALVRELVPSVPSTKVRFQYSPESFSDTEMDFALEICEGVMDAWYLKQAESPVTNGASSNEAPTAEPIILNLPATVEYHTPNVHADQIEWFCRNLSRRAQAIISLHTHNDRGTGVAATELGLLAGADRVEGTLFGNGERTGNLDIVIVALNFHSQGVDSCLDFRELDAIREVYQRTTRMDVHARWPYSGELVFTAFSGSHQDAIKKGMDRSRARDGSGEGSGAGNADGSGEGAGFGSGAGLWEVPYLTIDPQDIGRNYEAIVRINSQSGKGGVAFVLQRDYGWELPKSMAPQVGEAVWNFADAEGRELSSAEVRDYFVREFVERRAPLALMEHQLQVGHPPEKNAVCQARVRHHDAEHTIEGSGNGPINAFVHALENFGLKDFKLTDYRSHAIGAGSAVDSAAYIQIERQSDGARIWGVGINPSIEQAGLEALVCAWNRAR
ncbi:MAG: 2-isopropylmalate synthase [Opitutales bacterium]